MNTNHAVLCTMPATTLEGLMQYAIDQKVTHLWIMPVTGLAFTKEQAAPLLDTSRWDVGPEGKFITAQKRGKWKGYISSIVGRALVPHKTANTRLLFIEQGNWSFKNASPEHLLNIIKMVEDTLGVAMAGSPTSVGLRYLEKMNTRYYEHYFEKSADVDWEGLKDSHIPAFAWFPATQVEDGYYLHCVDRNGSHPFAASQEKMGVGTPYIQEGGAFDKSKPGLWDVEITGGPQGLALPPLFPTAKTWLPTPILRVAQIAGYQITVNQAFLWPEGKPIFERWAKSLWAFRERFENGTMERAAVKSIMNNVVGFTRVGDEMDSTMRPDWYATIIGSERAVVWYKAFMIGQKSGVYPIGTYCDALYYLSKDANPDTAIPGVLDHCKSLGGYKHVWTLPIDTAGREILAARMGAADRIGELKKLVEA